MPRDAFRPTPFARTFAVIGGFYIAAVAGLLVATGLGWSPPALVQTQTAWLLSGGGLVILAIIVPTAVFAIHRFTHASADHLNVQLKESHRELHAAHDDALDHVSREHQDNAAMHAADRNDLTQLGRRLDAHRKDIQNRALVSDLQDLQESLVAQRHSLERAQEALWADHMATHGNADEALADFQEATQSAEVGLTDTIRRLQGTQKELQEQLASAMQARITSIAELEDDIKELRLAQQQQRSNMERKLATMQSPESAMREWAERSNAYTDHELARFKHKITRRISNFEDREATALEDTGRHAREEAAMLAEDISRDRLADIEERNEAQMAQLKADLDEQFAAFLAGQQAQRTETEARLAAVGATRGVKVQGNEAYSVTSHAPFGRIYPIAEIEGIGNKTAYALQRMGILDTEHLWHGDVPELAAELAVTPRQIRQWQSQAELMAIDGVGKQWAELLAASGVLSIGHLANLHGRELIEQIHAHGFGYRQRLHKGTLNLAKAEDLIKKAREHKPEKEIHV